MAGKDVYDDDREAIGWVKRVLEYITMIPGFEEELKKDPKGTLDKYGFPLTPEDVALSHTDPDDPMRLVAVYPESKGKLYADFVNRKIRTVAKTRDDCTPSEPKFQKWRQRQMDRCLLDLGPQNMMIIHTPLTFELANGCSVGCEFCGLNAGPLRGLFRYTDENAALWKDILARAKELFGSAAGEGTLYFGTEPLDNPDYEHFKDDYFKAFDKRTAGLSTVFRSSRRICSNRYVKPLHRRSLRWWNSCHSMMRLREIILPMSEETKEEPARRQ